MIYKVTVDDTILFMQKTLILRSSSLEDVKQLIKETHPNYRIVNVESLGKDSDE